MELTKSQQEAITTIKELVKYEKFPKIYVLAGAAGTGKTTLLKLIPDELGGLPVAVAPTGKAALRLNEVTGIPTTTIHSWLYKVHQNNESGQLSFSRKDPEETKRADKPPLLCIDESSMVDETLWEDIYDVCVMLEMNILCIGDHEQLPPVLQKPDAKIPFSLVSPHFNSTKRLVLTEIVRQALDSPIIRASIAVRDGNISSALLTLPKINSAVLVNTIKEMYTADRGVFICHQNTTRQRVNQVVRSQLGCKNGELVETEPLLVMENNPYAQVFNGESLKFLGWDDTVKPREIHDRYNDVRTTTGFGIARVEHNKEIKKVILSDAQVLGLIPDKFSSFSLRKSAEIAYLQQRDLSRMSEEERMRFMSEPRFLSANLGYVLTCHKAQGSEWPEVVVGVETSLQLHKDDSKRWLYTAITRAKEKVTICLAPKV